VNDIDILLRGNGDFTQEQYEQVLRADDDRHLMLSLGLTTGPGCNMKCIFCYNDGGTREAGRSFTDLMTLADFEKAIKQSASLGAESAIIVGVGETMMDKKILQIIELIAESGMYPMIFTNGTRMDKETVKFLFKNRTTVYLSLNAVNEVLFDRISASKGLFSKVMEGIDNCLEAGFGKLTARHGFTVTDFGVNTMVMKSNAEHLGEIEQFCRERDILFTCRMPEKLGTAPSFWQKYIASSPQEEEKLKQTVARYYKGGEVFRTDNGCLFWVAGVLLGVDGQARLCYSLNNNKDFGNIKTDSMRDIILRKLKTYPPSREYFCPIHTEIGQPSSQS
jgi:MoaA/NifB/PqqE/SkfB family radical SAM enzyme